MRVVFNTPPTLARFQDCDDFVRCIVGPVGSGKSSVCVLELVLRAANQRPGPDGVRRSRFAVIRNTYPQLRDTTRKTFEQWIPAALGRWNEQAFSFLIETPLKDGTRVESEILFRALDRPEDVKKLLSLELTGAYINETREVPQHVLDVLQTRVGRYPAMLQGGASWFGIWMDTNPWHSGHWAAKLFAKGLEGHRLFRQPGGRAANAENVENLPNGYYDRLCIGKDKEWIRVYVDGEDATGDVGSIWGEWLAGLDGRGGICSFDAPTDEVFTSWDLGHRDTTAIWFWIVNSAGVPDLLDYYEANGEGLEHFFGVLDDKGYTYKRIFLPHDAKHQTLATQQTVYDRCHAKWKGLVSIVPDIGKANGIDAARWMLEQPMRIHERCLLPGKMGYSGADALRSYRYGWDEANQCYSREPVHDWASNGADAFRYTAVVIKVAAHLVKKEAQPVPKFVPRVYTMDDLIAENSTPQRRRI